MAYRIKKINPQTYIPITTLKYREIDDNLWKMKNQAASKIWIFVWFSEVTRKWIHLSIGP